MISEEKLIGWLVDHIDMEVSCYEDLEMTEGERNDYMQYITETRNKV
jgi:hypothetical protein